MFHFLARLIITPFILAFGSSSSHAMDEKVLPLASVFGAYRGKRREPPIRTEPRPVAPRPKLLDDTDQWVVRRQIRPPRK